MHLWQNPRHTSEQTYRASNRGIIFKLLNHLRTQFRSKTQVVSISAVASCLTTQTHQDIELASAHSTTASTSQVSPVSASQNLSTSPDPQNYCSSSEPGDLRSSNVFLRTPKKLGNQLLPDEEDPSEGWGLYFEEGFRFHHLFIVILFLYIIGSLVFGTYWCSKYGVVGPQSGAEAFSVSSWMIALISLVMVVWFKWVD